MFAQNIGFLTVGAYGIDLRFPMFRANDPSKKSRASHIASQWLHQTVIMTDDNSTKETRNPADVSKQKANAHSNSTHELERVYFNSFDVLVRSARILVDDLSTASDVVQEAFVKALVAQPRFENSDAFSYMKTAVMNQARSTLRKRGVSRKHLSVVPIEDTNIKTPQIDELPVDAEVIHLALKNLSDRQRECVMLSHTYSMTHKEIALQLGISEGSVKQHLSRGLKNLSDALKDQK